MCIRDRFGTNYPMISHAAATEGLGVLGFDEETLGLYLEGNARSCLLYTSRCV